MRPAHPRQLGAMVERDMRRWLERAVIGLNLCPFAKAVYIREQIHFAISWAMSPQALLRDLVQEMHDLVGLDPAVRDTTLLMAPSCLAEFLDFNDYLGTADQALRDLHLDGSIQIASFHPDFQFANTSADDITNFTNRAPYPTLHLLRESSVGRAVEAFPQAESIFERNVQTMERLGVAGWSALGLGRSVALPEGGGQNGTARGKMAP